MKPFYYCVPGGRVFGLSCMACMYGVEEEKGWRSSASMNTAAAAAEEEEEEEENQQPLWHFQNHETNKNC